MGHGPHLFTNFGVHTVELLLVEFGSDVPADTTAASQTCPTAERHETVITAVRVGAESGIDGHVQVTLACAIEQVAPVAVTVGGYMENRLEFATSETFWLSLTP